MASPFASLSVSDPIPLPFDEGQWVKVRKLTGRQHEDAQLAHRRAFIAGAWAETFRRALEKGKSDPQVVAALNDPLTGYDRYELVRSGLVAWSYAQPVDEKVIADLDDDAIEFIAREVLRRTKPGLFVASVEDAEAQKKSG